MRRAIWAMLTPAQQAHVLAAARRRVNAGNAPVTSQEARRGERGYMNDLAAIRERWADTHWAYAQEISQSNYISDACVYTPIYVMPGCDTDREPLVHADFDEPNETEVAFLRKAAQAPDDIRALLEEIERLRQALYCYTDATDVQSFGYEELRDNGKIAREALGYDDHNWHMCKWPNNSECCTCGLQDRIRADFEPQAENKP